MTTGVLLDAGPLVAYIDRRQEYHEWAMAQFVAAAPPMLSCESVLAEACHLLRRVPKGRNAVVELVQRGVISLPFRLADHAAAVAALMAKYADVPMSLADACLVRMAEIHDRSPVLTLDADFGVYRKHGRLVIPVITPRRS